MTNDPGEAADLAWLLPQGSFLKGAIDNRASWTPERYMLASMVNRLSGTQVFRFPDDKSKKAAGQVERMTLEEILKKTNHAT